MEEETEEQFKSQNWASKCYTDEQVKGNKEKNAPTFESDFNEIDSRTFGEDKLYSENPRKTRVKSAPVLVNHKSRCPRKVYSAGIKILNCCLSIFVQHSYLSYLCIDGLVFELPRPK